MNSYIALKERRQREVNEFPFFFAFNTEQFEQGMAKFGLTPDDMDKIYRLSDVGGFYLRTDSARLKEMWDRHEREQNEAIANDETGEGYIYQMFLYELDNHEYGYTGNPEEALGALCITPDEIVKSSRLQRGYSKAVDEIRQRKDA